MMRGPNPRTRSLALVLLLVCAGAFWYGTPPIPGGSAGEASLVQQVGTAAAAVPAASWTATIDGGRGHSPGPSRPFHGMRSSVAVHGNVLARRPAARVHPPSSSGSALLGLPFVPANAPPHV